MPKPSAAHPSMHSHTNNQPLALRPSANAALPSAAVTAAPPLSSGPPPSAVRSVAAKAASPLVLLPSKDGLPLLPSHAQSCGVDPPRALRPLDYGHQQKQWTTGVVDVFGDVSSREAIREKLLRFYEATKQVAITRTNDEDEGDQKSADAAEILVGGGISEMTLRIDTELELLRQQCFAERNAQWDYYTPDMFCYEPVREPLWNPLLVGNTKIALRRLKHDARATTTERDEKETAVAANGVGGGSLSTSAMMKKDGKGFPLGQFSRDRPWPPREFMQKATTRPSRARGGKRKAPAPVIEERSIFSKLCVECRTQSTPLWRRIARESTSLKDVPITTNIATTVKNEKAPSVPVPNGALANGATSLETPDGQLQEQPPAVVDNTVDVCLECYLKLQRSDIFARKATERAQQQREQQERAATEALAEKKRLKQQIQLLKKQQQAQAKNSKKRKPAVHHEPVVEQQSVAPIEAPATATDAATTAAAAIKIVIKTDVGLENNHAFDDHEEQLDHVSRPKSAKRDKKKGKKDKKKKKKKKKQHYSDDDDEDLESDSGTPLPSPPQMVGQYEYADLGGGGGNDTRSSRSASSVTSFDAVVENHSVVYEDELVQGRQQTTTADAQVQQTHVMAEETMTTSSSSKRTRKSTSRTEISTTTATSATTTTTASVTPSSSSKSRKRKNLVVVAAPAAAVVPEAAIEAPQSTSSRSSRSKASSTIVAPAPAPLVSVVAPAPPVSARKRARTKKESARERELRALGQYCPVCNAVYEEDDESSFVCCDSCEMWVHAACDTTLTPYVLVLCD